MRRKLTIIWLLTFALLFTLAQVAHAQENIVQINSPVESTSEASSLSFVWNKSFDYEGITEQCLKLVKAYPDLVQMESIGESASGRRIWVLTISNHGTGNVHLKPGYLVEGNALHQPTIGSDHALYLAWHLAKNYTSDKEIAHLLEHKVFYIIPVSFPDTKAKRSSATKGYAAALDDDNDGRMEEDGPDDLTNDGVITLMRRKAFNGKYIADKKNPLKLIVAPANVQGEYEWMGYEGFDNDRDGQVNEDPVGYQSIDWDWGWKWQPRFGISGSSSTYPFSIPENRALKDFVTKHPNIAAAQIQYQQDDAVLLRLSKDQTRATNLPGLEFSDQERLAAFVANSNKWNWFKYARGVHTFPVQILTQQGQQDSLASEQGREEVEGLNSYQEWTPFEHPVLGPIEIGGLQVLPTNVPSGDYLVKDLESFARQTIANALQLPQLVIQNIERKVLNDGLTEVTATILNAGLLPTHTQEDLAHNLERADYISLKDGVVVASTLLGEASIKSQISSLTPGRIEVASLPSNTIFQVRWIVKPTSPTMVLEIDSRKGGVVSTRF